MVCKVLGESDRETNSSHLFFLSVDMRCSVVCFLSSAVTLHNTPQLDVVTFGSRKQHRHCQSRIQTHKNYVLQHRLAMNNCPTKEQGNEARSTSRTPADDKEERSVDNQTLRQSCRTVHKTKGARSTFLQCHLTRTPTRNGRARPTGRRQPDRCTSKASYSTYRDPSFGCHPCPSRPRSVRKGQTRLRRSGANSSEKLQVWEINVVPFQLQAVRRSSLTAK